MCSDADTIDNIDSGRPLRKVSDIQDALASMNTFQLGGVQDMLASISSTPQLGSAIQDALASMNTFQLGGVQDMLASMSTLQLSDIHSALATIRIDTFDLGWLHELDGQLPGLRAAAMKAVIPTNTTAAETTVVPPQVQVSPDTPHPAAYDWAIPDNVLKILGALFIAAALMEGGSTLFGALFVVYAALLEKNRH
jgi:hypothetical protein